MKRIVVSVVLVLAVASCNKKSGSSADGGASADPAASSAGGLGLGILNGFEGEIGLLVKGSMAGKGAGAPQQLTTDIKGDKVRLEMPSGMGGPVGDKGFIVFAGGEKKLTIVDDTKKQAMVIDLNKQGESPLKGMTSRGGGSPKNPPKVTKTGKTDTVAGYKCEIWQIEEEGKGKVGEVCVAQEGFSWLSLPASHLPIEHGWAIELMDGKHFPLRFIGFENGAESGRIEVTKIEKKTIAPSVFEVPAGYKVIDLGQMMQGMPTGFPSGMQRPNIPRPPTR